MTSTDNILDTIDTALSDNTISPDAMRNAPASDTALRIGDNGTVTVIPLDRTNTLATLRTAIDCAHVDVVGLRGYDMWIDDEGLYNGNENILATLLAELLGHATQTYFGSVVIARVDEEGDTLGLRPADLKFLGALLDGMRADYGE